jgi:hypothetical protein
VKLQRTSDPHLGDGHQPFQLPYPQRIGVRFGRIGGYPRPIPHLTHRLARAAESLGRSRAFHGPLPELSAEKRVPQRQPQGFRPAPASLGCCLRNTDLQIFHLLMRCGHGGWGGVHTLTDVVLDRSCPALCQPPSKRSPRAHHLRSQAGDLSGGTYTPAGPIQSSGT